MMPWSWDQPWFAISAVATAALIVGLYVAVCFWVFRRWPR